MIKKIDMASLKMIVVVSFFLFVSKFAGLVKELVVASKFGVGYEVDSFSFVFGLYTWPLGLFMSVLTVVLVPLIAKVRSEGNEELDVFSRELFALLIIFSFIIALAFYVFFFIYGAHLNSSEKVNLAVIQIYPYFTVYLITGIYSTLFSVLMIAQNNHANSALEGVIPLFIVIFVLMLTGYLSLTIGLVVGSVAQFLILYIMYSLRNNLILPKFSFTSIQWGVFKKGFSIVLLGQVMISSTAVIDQLIASRFSEGTLSTISYSTKISTIFMALVSLSITRAMLPIFSERVISDNIEAVKMSVIKWGGVFFILGSVISVFCSLFSDTIISIIYERGMFTKENVESVANFFAISSYQFPFYFSAMVFIAFFNSRCRYTLIMVSGCVGFLVKVLFYYVFINVLGDEVILYSTVSMYMTTFLFFLIFTFIKEPA